MTGANLREWIGARTIQRGECMLWLRACDRYGYGHFHAGGKTRLAHREVMGWVLGRPLRRSEFVLHACDTPSCVNPAHLSVGTQRQNMAQSVARETTRRRYRRLTGAAASSIVRLLNEGLSRKEVARLVGVSLSSVKRWAHVAVQAQGQLL